MHINMQIHVDLHILELLDDSKPSNQAVKKLKFEKDIITPQLWYKHQVNTYNRPRFQFQVNRQRFDEDMRTGVSVANDMKNLIWQGHVKYTIIGRPYYLFKSGLLILSRALLIEILLNPT